MSFSNFSFENPLVVGYKGEIGSFILQGLLREMPKASNIWCFDVNDTEKERVERIEKSDTIFLCVPMQDTVKWLHKYAKLLKKKLIVEQCSLKSAIYEDEKIKKLKIMSMHVLFRPSATPNKSDRRVALLGKPEGFWVRMPYEIELITKSEVVWFYNYKDHDKCMATQQALVHRVILALARIISQQDNQTYMGNKILELEDRILDGDPTLYRLIQENKYLPEVLKEFKKGLYGSSSK